MCNKTLPDRKIINFWSDPYLHFTPELIIFLERHALSCLSPYYFFLILFFLRNSNLGKQHDDEFLPRPPSPRRPERFLCHFVVASGHHGLVGCRLISQLESVSALNAISAWSCLRCGRKHRASTHVNISTTS